MDEISLSIADRSVEFLDPSMDPVDKVGKMAGICYRIEPKEGEDEHACNIRRVQHCIKSGHVSVLEHVAFSVFIPSQEVRDSWKIVGKLLGKGQGAKVNFQDVWLNHRPESQNRYLMPFADVELFYKHAGRLGRDVSNENIVALPVWVGDASAWRRVIRDKMMIGGQMADEPLDVLLTLRVLQTLHTAAPVFFDDIYEQINKSFGMMAAAAEKNEQVKNSCCWKMMIERVPAEKRNVDGVVEYFFETPEDIFGDVAAKAATMSVILTTDRATTHQIVRHRKDVGYSQESQRYVNYDKKGYRAMALTCDPRRTGDKFKVDPMTGVVDKESEVYKFWEKCMKDAFSNYGKLLEMGLPPESARGVLPNDCMTRIGITWLLPDGFCNFAFWRVDDHAQISIRSTVDKIITEGICMHHPFIENLNPDLLVNWCRVMLQQGIIAQEKLDEIIKIQDERKKAIAEMQKKYQEAMEAQAKAEAEARAKDPRPKNTTLHDNALPPGEKPEHVEERPPTVEFEKPPAETDSVQLDPEARAAQDPNAAVFKSDEVPPPAPEPMSDGPFDASGAPAEPLMRKQEPTPTVDPNGGGEPAV